MKENYKPEQMLFLASLQVPALLQINFEYPPHLLLILFSMYKKIFKWLAHKEVQRRYALEENKAVIQLSKLTAKIVAINDDLQKFITL